MATKKTVKKTEPKKRKDKAEKTSVISEELVAVKKNKEVNKEKNILGEYFYAVGRRKTSVAQVRLFVSDKKENVIKINGKDLSEYFSLLRFQSVVGASLTVAGDRRFFITVHVVGGGIMGQAEAIRLGIARALVKYNEELKKQLKDLGFLTRDARVVERKKPGKLKARRSPQWAKR